MRLFNPIHSARLKDRAMKSDYTNTNRLLLEMDKTLRELNRAIINPAIPELSLADLAPIMTMTAHARAAYLKELFDIAQVVGEGTLSPDQIQKLRSLREGYDELVKASQALETAMERGYLDIHR